MSQFPVLQARLKHITLLRAVAIILVVIGHSTRNTATPNYNMFNPAVTSFVEILVQKYIYSFHMPLFFWISGYVYCYTGKNNNEFPTVLKEVYRKFKRLIIPLYSTFFLVILPIRFIFGQTNEDLIQIIKTSLLCENIDHLWFLKDLFLIFIIMIPLSLQIRKAPLFINCLGFMFFFALSYNNTQAPAFAQGAIEYLPFFYAGYMTKNFEILPSVKKALRIFFLFFVLHASIAFVSLPSTDRPFPHANFIWYCMAFSGTYYMYYLAVYACQTHALDKIWNLVVDLDRSSYAVFLFHVVFLYIVLFWFYSTQLANPLYRIIPSFFFGLFVPIFINYSLVRNKYLAFLFSSHYAKDI